jgi:hypothetical protein
LSNLGHSVDCLKGKGKGIEIWVISMPFDEHLCEESSVCRHCYGEKSCEMIIEKKREIADFLWMPQASPLFSICRHDDVLKLVSKNGVETCFLIY